MIYKITVNPFDNRFENSNITRIKALVRDKDGFIYLRLIHIIGKERMKIHHLDLLLYSKLHISKDDFII